MTANIKAAILGGHAHLNVRTTARGMRLSSSDLVKLAKLRAAFQARCQEGK